MEGNYGLWALIPAIIAIFMCFKTKQVIPSLFAGVFSAGVIISKGNIFAAPSASLFISDWIALKIGMISQGLLAAGLINVSLMSAYISSIPYNLYSIFTLAFVGMIVITGLDYGPMLKAERRAIKTGKFCSDEAQPMLDVANELGEPKDVKPRLITFIVPFIIMLALFGRVNQLKLVFLCIKKLT